MPLLKYTLLVGSSLLALLFVAERVIAPTTAATNASTSLDVLRKMANHGEVRGFAPLADAGVFLPMPATSPQPVVAVADTKPAVAAVPPALLNAQARVVEAEVIDKPLKPVRKTAARKPKPPRSDYVENIPRGPGGFFGAFQSW